MKFCTRETRGLAVLSVILLGIQPLLHIRKVGMFLNNWNPLSSVLANLQLRNSERQIFNAEEYFKSVDQLDSQQQTLDEEIDNIVCIITVHRGKRPYSPRYLLQTASHMHRAIKSDTFFGKSVLLICNVDSDPESHRDAKYLKNYALYVDQSGDTNFGSELNPKVQSIHREEPRERLRRKEIEDYAFCLNVTQSFNSKFVLMLEDDIVPHEDLFRVLYYTGNNYRRYRYINKPGSDCSENTLDHVQLYYVDHLSNAKGYIISVLKNSSLCVIGGCAVLYFATLFSTKSKQKFRCAMFMRGVFVTCILSTVLKNDFYLELFRFSPQMYTKMPLPKSSAVAMYYNSDVVPNLVNHLLYKANGTGMDAYKDIAINNYFTSSGLNSFLLKPYLVEHIGTISTKDFISENEEVT